MRENNDADAEKFAILYFLHSFVLSNIETVAIPRLHFDLIDSGRYKDFPWGSLSFEDLARNLNNRLKAGGQFYLIQGMPLAIQVWLYECCSNFPPKIASKVDNRIPPLLNWKTIASRPRFEFLMNAMFNDDGKHIDVCFYDLRKKSKYGPHSSYKNEPNKSYKYSTVDCNFMNIIRSLNNVYSMDAQNLKDGGQEHHLMEYINGFRIHAAVPWHTVEDIFIPVNIKEKHHWVLTVLSFLERCIFLYDSYEFSGHYATVLAEIEKIAKIIPLCLQACDFYVNKGVDHQSHPRYKDKESSDMFDVLFQDDLPQQSSGSLLSHPFF
ncbi:hypothetical protein BC332_31286 [Capsicum chinense]|nr:hypothetical protein BC332_31286 [Capsicum chinense]